MKYIIKDHIEYKEYNYEGDENTFEKDVIAHDREIFGENMIYIDIKKRLKPNKRQDGTIPDGYLLDLSQPRLYLVENELRSHGIKEHIAPQLTNFFLNYKDSLDKIKETVIEYLNMIHYDVDTFCQNNKFRNIDDLLTSIMINNKLGVYIIIDDADYRLQDLKNCFAFDIEILEFKKYINDKHEAIYLFDKVSDQPSLLINTKDNLDDLNTIVVAAYLDGFQEEFIENNRWFAVSIGINRIDSLKYIAVYQKNPIKAITYYAEIDKIEPYEDTGKYIIYFKNKAIKLKHPISLKNPNKAPQGRVYTNINKIIKASKNTTLDDIF